jgi:membrane associated rhomboid family serine protease
MPDNESQKASLRSPPAFNVPPATLWTGLFLCGVFAGLRLGPDAWFPWMLDHLAFSTRGFAQALETGPLLAGLAPLVTHSFIHVDPLHLLLNLGFLVAFGSFVERSYGMSWYAALFLAAAAAGALTQFAFANQESVMIGASGGVYGLMGAYVPVLSLRRSGSRWRGGLGFVAVILVLNIVIGPLSAWDDAFGAPIAWQAHIGGFLLGLGAGFALLGWRVRRALRRYDDAKR